MNNQDRILAAATRANIPLDVAIELTHRCNLRCQHCYIPDFHAPDLLSTERVLSLLDELAELGTLIVTLTGGELFIRTDWQIIARHARRLGFALRLLTNATLIDERTADAVAVLHADVEVSLHSTSAECFDTVTGREGSFLDARRGIELLRQRDVRVVLKVPLTKFNHDQLQEIRAFGAHLGAQVRAFAELLPRRDGDLTPLSCRATADELLPFFESMPAMGCTIEDGAGTVADAVGVEGPLCAAAVRYCTITNSGAVQACSALPRSGGNINELSFREIWDNSPWLRRVRNIRRNDLHRCKTCRAFSSCGRCQAQALLEDGDLLGPSSAAGQRARIADRISVRRARSI